jgi:hypothetical protein
MPWLSSGRKAWSLSLRKGDFHSSAGRGLTPGRTDGPPAQWHHQSLSRPAVHQNVRCEQTVGRTQRLLVAWIAVLAGCSSERGQELNWQFIACTKSPSGQWLSFERASAPFYQVQERRIRVFVDKQQVVELGAFGPRSLDNCTVFDKDNWTCTDDRDQVVVQQGRMPLQCGATLCFAEVRVEQRARLLFLGATEADRLCTTYARLFELVRKGSPS